MVYPLVDPLLVVQDYEGLSGRGISCKDEAEIAALTLHIREVYQGGVKSGTDKAERKRTN